MPDPARLLTTLRRARDIIASTPSRRGKLVTLAQAKEILVAGDLHGNVENFSQLLKAADLTRHRDRHLVLQEIIHGPFRYPDGSDKSHQLLDLLAALSCQFPHRVHCLMGNHELSQWTARAIGKGEEACNNLFLAGIATAYGDQAEAIAAVYGDLFAVLPLAIRTANRVFLSHSLPGGSRLAAFQLTALEKEELIPADVTGGGAAYALVWGRDTREETVQTFLGKVDADLLITGHIPCPDGYATPNSRQLVLDASGSPACYCLFPANEPVSLDDLVGGVHLL
jgi:hypothetical protein